MRAAARSADMTLGVVHDLPVGVDATRRRRVGAGRRARPRGERRGATGQLHPARTGLGAAAVATGPPRRHRLRGAAGHAARRARATPTDCGSTMSPGCGGCGGFRPATARIAAPTCTTTPTSCSRSWRWRRIGQKPPWSARTWAPSNRRSPQALADNEMLGCAVSWFTRDESAPGEPLLPPAKWPSRAAASLSTHDLPTAAGFLCGEHVRARADLGLLDDVPAEQAAADKERAEWLALLRSEGLLSESAESNRRGGHHRGDAPAAGGDPEPTEVDLALRRDRRAVDSPTCPARSTSTRIGGSRCRRPLSSCAPTPGRRDHVGLSRRVRPRVVHCGLARHDTSKMPICLPFDNAQPTHPAKGCPKGGVADYLVAVGVC